MQASLKQQSASILEEVVQRLMKQERFVAATPKRLRHGSCLGETSPARGNLVTRDFNAAAPNKKRLTNITEFPIPTGKVHLLALLDCFGGFVVSWSVGTRPDTDRVDSMLDAAINTIVLSGERPILHADERAQRRWPGPLSRIPDEQLSRHGRVQGLSRPIEDSAALSRQLAVRVHCVIHSDAGFIHSLVQREADQNLARRSQPYRAPLDTWGLAQPVQDFFRHPNPTSEPVLGIPNAQKAKNPPEGGFFLGKLGATYRDRTGDTWNHNPVSFAYLSGL